MPAEAAQAEFRISRLFKAPRRLVWNAWTDPAPLAQWFGPKGVTTQVITFDLRPGGMAHSRMDTPDGHVMWARFVYREVEPPSRLAWAHAFSDENAGVVRGPFDPNWPLELLTTVLFEDEDGGTRITLTWSPLNSTDIERQTFEAAIPSMTMGWTGSFDQLEAFLRARNG
jgi:uncharacterized protein YndB with AHSA1/START domain